jgi:hypothetical protein
VVGIGEQDNLGPLLGAGNFVYRIKTSDEEFIVDFGPISHAEPEGQTASLLNQAPKVDGPSHHLTVPEKGIGGVVGKHAQADLLVFGDPGSFLVSKQTVNLAGPDRSRQKTK